MQGAGSALVAPASLGLLLACLPGRPARHGGHDLGWDLYRSGGPPWVRPLGASIRGRAAQWRWVFFVYVPIALTTAALSRLLLAESSEPENGRIPDWVGVVMLCVALAALALGIVEGRDWAGATLGCWARSCWRWWSCPCSSGAQQPIPHHCST